MRWGDGEDGAARNRCGVVEQALRGSCEGMREEAQQALSVEPVSGLSLGR